MKSLLLFGAGKIGRSFIGQLFARSGYKIVFVDIDPQLVDSLNRAESYKIITLDNNHPEKEGEDIVKNVSAIHLSDKVKIIDCIVKADIIALSVGKQGLFGLSELLSEGIQERYRVRNQHAIDIILAENVRDAADLLRKELHVRIGDLVPDQFVGLVETSIGKMVPIMTEEQLSHDPLSVFAESYNTLIVDALGFRNIIPDIEGLAPKTNMKAWVDRKIFIHNLGHATLAYHAYMFDSDLVYTWEALEIEQLRDITRRTMLQSMDILISLYPDEFTHSQLIAHIDDLLDRFSNKSLGDTIYRVGCDLSRKLNSDDRLLVPVLTAITKQKDYNLILEAWVNGCFFEATDGEGKSTQIDIDFRNKYATKPLLILSRHCKLDIAEYPMLFEGVDQILIKMISTSKD